MCGVLFLFGYSQEDDAGQPRSRWQGLRRFPPAVEPALTSTACFLLVQSPLLPDSVAGPAEAVPCPSRLCSLAIRVDAARWQRQWRSQETPRSSPAQPRGCTGRAVRPRPWDLLLHEPRRPRPRPPRTSSPAAADSKYFFSLCVLFGKFTATLVQLWRLSGRFIAYGKICLISYRQRLETFYYIVVYILISLSFKDMY